MSSGDDQQPGKSHWLDVSLILSLAAAITGFIKIWSFARGNTETLQVMLAAGGLASTFAAWLAVSAPFLVATSWIFVTTSLGEALREDEPWIPALLATAFTAALGLLLVPSHFTILLAIYAIFQVAYGITAKIWRGWASRRDREAPWLLRLSGGQRVRLSARGHFVISVIGAFLLAIIFTPPWLVKERFEIQTGQHFIGYAVDEQADFIILVEDESRRPVALRSGGVTNRTFCLSEWGGKSFVATWLWAQPERPDRCAT